MINPGFKLSLREVKELQDFKYSEAYSTYLRSIAHSPAFIALMDEHINNVNIEEDVSKLKKEGRIPETVTAKAVAGLFKQTLNRMAIGIMADSVILKELEDCSVDEVINGLKTDSDIMYLLGKADKKYYVQAAELVEEGKLDKNSLAFRGLMAYMKLNNKEFQEPKDACRNLSKEKQPMILDQSEAPKSGRKKLSKINIHSDEIKL